MDDQSSPSCQASTTSSSTDHDSYRIPLFTYVTRTSSTSYTTDIRLFFAITTLTAVIVYARGLGWEFMLLLLAGGTIVWKTAKPREGMEFKRVKRALRA